MMTLDSAHLVPSPRIYRLKNIKKKDVVLSIGSNAKGLKEEKAEEEETFQYCCCIYKCIYLCWERYMKDEIPATGN